MLLVNCPYCGARPETEFRYGGEAHRVRPTDPAALDDDAWTAYLYDRKNPRGWHLERWRHIACGRFFNAARDTVSDVFAGTYVIGDAPPPRPGASRGRAR